MNSFDTDASFCLVLPSFPRFCKYPEVPTRRDSEVVFSGKVRASFVVA